MIYDFAVIGGDMRQVYLANYLKNQRYQVITYATKKEGSKCHKRSEVHDWTRRFFKKRGNHRKF